MRFPAGILFVASLASADESLIGNWMTEVGTDSISIRDDGTLGREVGIDVENFLAPSDLGFSEDPEIKEAMAALIPGRTVYVSLSGTWESRGSRFLTVYRAAEVEGWEELVDDMMEIAGPAMEERLEGSENADFLIGAYRALLKSLFSPKRTFQFGEETFVYWSIEGEVLTLGGDVYIRVIETLVQPVSWGELKNKADIPGAGFR